MTANKNIFEEAFIKQQNAKRAYDAATTEEERDLARVQFDDAGCDIPNTQVAQHMARSYVESRENENDYLDFSDVVSPDDVEEIVNLMKENNIEHFTYSSGWSSAVKTAWAFQCAGCKLEGMVEINTQMRNWRGEGFEKTPAYLFSL